MEIKKFSVGGSIKNNYICNYNKRYSFIYNMKWGKYLIQDNVLCKSFDSMFILSRLKKCWSLEDHFKNDYLIRIKLIRKNIKLKKAFVLFKNFVDNSRW